MRAQKTEEKIKKFKCKGNERHTKRQGSCKKELKVCNLSLICLVLNHKGIVGNQCRLIATFTELQKTQTISVFLFLYLLQLLYCFFLCQSQSYFGHFIRKIWGNCSWTRKVECSVRPATIWLIAVCVFVCACVRVSVYYETKCSFWGLSFFY